MYKYIARKVENKKDDLILLIQASCNSWHKGGGGSKVALVVAISSPSPSMFAERWTFSKEGEQHREVVLSLVDTVQRR